MCSLQEHKLFSYDDSKECFELNSMPVVSIGFGSI